MAGPATKTNYKGKTPRIMPRDSQLLSKPSTPTPAIALPSTSNGGGFKSMVSNINAAVKAQANNQPQPPTTLQASPPSPFLKPEGLDTRAYEKITSNALSDSPSAWLKMAEDKQRQEEQYALDQIASTSAGRQAEALSNLAMRGGVNSGAALNLASTMGNQDLLEQQKIRQQGALTRAGLGIEDYNTKQQQLMQLPSMASNVFTQYMQDQGSKALSDYYANQAKAPTMASEALTALEKPFTAANRVVSWAGDVWSKLARVNTSFDPTGGLYTASKNIFSL